MMPTLAAILLIAGFTLLLWFGHESGRFTARRSLATGGTPVKGIGVAEGTVFTLLGLLLAFTFSGAAQRFEQRRHLITTEANAIGTAYLRIDILPAESQAPIRTLFREYVRVRTELFYSDSDDNFTERLQACQALQQRIWQQSQRAAGMPGASPAASMLMLPALNEMIDITTTRRVALINHPPTTIFVLLGILCLLASVLTGYAGGESRQRSWLHILSFCLTLAITAYVIIDLEFPRLGLIQVETADQIIAELEQGMR
jgi:hypothetical protein